MPVKGDRTISDLTARHVLFVDDEQDILPEYQEFFDLAGFSTLTSADPSEAFDLVLNSPEIAVVITDMRMAMIDGGSLIRCLRAALPVNRHVSFIILTGDASAPSRAEIVDVPVFLKPADTDALIAAIQKALLLP